MLFGAWHGLGAKEGGVVCGTDFLAVYGRRVRDQSQLCLADLFLSRVLACRSSSMIQLLCHAREKRTREVIG